MKPEALLQQMSTLTGMVSRTRTDRRTLAKDLEKELHKAAWQKQLALGPIDDLEKMTKTVKPICEGFWYDSDQGILARLDQAARRLKERRKAQLQDNKEDDKAMSATPQPREELLPL